MSYSKEPKCPECGDENARQKQTEQSSKHINQKPKPMNITLDELAALIGTKSTLQKQDLGQNIVVLDRGFVYVGDVTIDGDFAVITNAKNIRYWGTKKGLGELTSGPLPETKLDNIGTVKAPMRAVIHFVPCQGF